MKADLYNAKMEVIDKVEIPDRIFGYPWKPDLVKQALDTQEKNSRKPFAHAKGRGEVSGGGKKPWRQKGTGRARHGSTRSPIWKGGGVSHGPKKERDYSVKLNQKMRQAAMFSVLARKLQDNEVKFVDSLTIAEPKTKMLHAHLKAFFGKKTPNALLIPEAGNKNIHRASANLPKVKSLGPKDLNVYDLMKFKEIFIEKNAIEAIDSHYHAVK
ncbi:MAG: 50S ribosomal protein L4 [Patescibacteria group bacterium]|nr:50S ribosomal protein L4 [Patescibacteria group bacterium]MCL5261715.1 50S ribosomal protein L4 [Patescibacteria group bacterium]